MERGSKREAGYVKSKLSSLTHFVLSFVLSPDQEKKPPGQRDGAAHEVCICCLSIPASVKASDTDRFVRACGQTVLLSFSGSHERLQGDKAKQHV